MKRTIWLVALVACATKPAPPPPADGVVAAGDLERSALANTTAWAGKRITVTGPVTGTGGVLLNVDGVACILARPADASMIGATVTVVGTVTFTKTRRDGRAALGVELTECTATAR